MILNNVYEVDSLGVKTHYCGLKSLMRNQAGYTTIFKKAIKNKKRGGCDHRLIKIEWRVQYPMITIPVIPKYFVSSQTSSMKNVVCACRNSFSHFRVFIEANNCLELSQKQKINRLTQYFYFCWYLCMAAAWGYRSPRKWHSESYNPALGALLTRQRRLLQGGMPRNDQILINLSKEIQQVRCRNRTHKWYQTLAAIEREGLYSTTFNRVYREAGGTRSLPVDPKELKTHFQNIFGEKFVLTPEKLEMVAPRPSEYNQEHYEIACRRLREIEEILRPENDNLRDPDNRCPGVDEIAEIIKRNASSKPHSAPGRDKITWRQLQKVFPFIKNEFMLFLEELWRAEVMPSESEVDKLIPLPKDLQGDLSSTDNFRPIFLQSVPLTKILDSVFDSRLRRRVFAKLQPEQGGFRRGRGTTEQSFVIKSIFDKFRGRRPLYCAFLDKTKAFDRTPRWGVWLKLYEYGVPGKLWRMIRATYKNLRAKFSCGGTEELLEILSGVREGGMSSPGKFNIFFDSLIKHLKRTGEGVEIGGVLICALFYADDIVLFSHTPEGLQRLLDACFEFAVKWHMSYGIKKCQVVAQEIVSSDSLPIFKLGTHELATVEWYRYLGVEETCDGLDYSVFMSEKWKKVHRRLPACQKVGARGDGMSLRSVRILYLTQLRPIIEWGLTNISPNANCTITTSKKVSRVSSCIQEMESMQKLCIKRMCGALPSTKYESLLLSLGIKSMDTRSDQLKLNFFNKIKLFPKDFYVRRVLAEQFNGEAIEHSFSANVREIFYEYGEDETYCRWLPEYETLEIALSPKMFKSLVRKVCDSVDFQDCCLEVASSAFLSTGQGRLTHAATQHLNSHAGVLQILGKGAPQTKFV